MNTALDLVVKKLEDKPNLSSHSFRAGYITQLWKSNNDIEFVRQAIGHVSISSTLLYVENLPDDERKARIRDMKTPKELIIPTILFDDNDNDEDNDDLLN